MNDNFFAPEVEFFHAREERQRAVVLRPTDRSASSSGPFPRFLRNTTYAGLVFATFFAGSVGLTENVRVEKSVVLAANGWTHDSASPSLVLSPEDFGRMLEKLHHPDPPNDVMLRLMATPMWS